MTALGVTVLASGSAGNALLVHNNHQEGLLIDSGLSLRALRQRMRISGLSENMVKGILITHEHIDHIRGLRVCAEYFKVPVYASRLCAEKLRYLDPKLGAVVRFAPGGEFQLGELESRLSRWNMTQSIRWDMSSAAVPGKLVWPWTWGRPAG